MCRHGPLACKPEHPGTGTIVRLISSHLTVSTQNSHPYYFIFFVSSSKKSQPHKQATTYCQPLLPLVFFLISVCTLSRKHHPPPIFLLSSNLSSCIPLQALSHTSHSSFPSPIPRSRHPTVHLTNPLFPTNQIPLSQKDLQSHLIIHLLSPPPTLIQPPSPPHTFTSTLPRVSTTTQNFFFLSLSQQYDTPRVGPPSAHSIMTVTILHDRSWAHTPTDR